MNHTPARLSPIIAHKSTSLFPKKTSLVLAFLVFIITLLGYLKFTYKPIEVGSYEECVQRSDSLLQESYPTICVASNGQRFTEPLPETPPTPVQPTITPTPNPQLNPLTGWRVHFLEGYTLETPPEWTVVNTDNSFKIVDQVASPSYTLELYQSKIDKPLAEYISDQKAIAQNATPDNFIWKTSRVSLGSLSATKIITNLPGFILFADLPDNTRRLEIAFLGEFNTNPTLTNQILTSFALNSPTPASASANL